MGSMRPFFVYLKSKPGAAVEAGIGGPDVEGERREPEESEVGGGHEEIELGNVEVSVFLSSMGSADDGGH